MNPILLGAIGGVISSVAIPFTSYITIRFVNRCRTNIRSETKIRNADHGYDTLNMRVINKSWATLKNVIPYIILEYRREMIRSDPNVETYIVETSNKPLMLSWAKVIADGNIPEININQQEEPDLNLFRYHHNLGGRALLQIASEQGFSTRGKKGRVLLELDTDLPFEILVTAENMSPIQKKYILKVQSMEIIKVK